MQFDSKLWKIYHVDERTAFTYVISQKRVPLSQFCMYCIIYFQGTTLKIYTVFFSVPQIVSLPKTWLLMSMNRCKSGVKAPWSGRCTQLWEPRSSGGGHPKRGWRRLGQPGCRAASGSVPTLWIVTPKRLPCRASDCGHESACDHLGLIRSPFWIGKKKKKKEHLLCSTCYCSHNSPPLKNTHVYIEWETHTQTHMRLTATPTAAVMIMTSPSMLKSWFTVRWTASKSSIAVRM